MAEQDNTNRTEADVSAEAVRTPQFQHLAPVLHAGDAGLPGEEMTTVIVPRAFNITLSDGTRQRIAFLPGTYDIPSRFLKHYYLKANGVVSPTAKRIEKPETETGLDRSMLTPEYLDGLKFPDLKNVFAQIGGDVTLIRGNTSKDDLRQMVAEKLKADAAK